MRSIGRIKGLSKYRFRTLNIPDLCGVALCIVTIALTGCGFVPEKVIRTGVYIEEADGVWKMNHGGYSGAKTYWLTSDVATISLWVDRAEKGEYSAIVIWFDEVGGAIDFSPSRITVKLGDGRIFKAQGFCPDCRQERDSGKFRAHSPAGEQIPVSRYSCYRVDFDHSALPFEEEFVMYMNDALTQGDHKIAVPPIHFRKTVEYQFHIGLAQ